MPAPLQVLLSRVRLFDVCAHERKLEPDALWRFLDHALSEQPILVLCRIRVRLAEPLSGSSEMALLRATEKRHGFVGLESQHVVRKPRHKKRHSAIVHDEQLIHRRKFNHLRKLRLSLVHEDKQADVFLSS